MISNEVNFCLNIINSVKYLSANITLLNNKKWEVAYKNVVYQNLELSVVISFQFSVSFIL